VCLPMQRSLGPGILRTKLRCGLQRLSQGCSCWPETRLGLSSWWAKLHPSSKVSSKSLSVTAPVARTSNRHHRSASPQSNSRGCCMRAARARRVACRGRRHAMLIAPQRPGGGGPAGRAAITDAVSLSPIRHLRKRLDAEIEQGVRAISGNQQLQATAGRAGSPPAAAAVAAKGAGARGTAISKVGSGKWPPQRPALQPERTTAQRRAT